MRHPTKKKYNLPTADLSDPVVKQAKDSLHWCCCGSSSIIAPAGKCPFSLEVITEESIFKWAVKLIRYWHGRQRHLTPAGMRYYLGQLIGFDSPEYKKGTAILADEETLQLAYWE